MLPTNARCHSWSSVNWLPVRAWLDVGFSEQALGAPDVALGLVRHQLWALHVSSKLKLELKREFEFHKHPAAAFGVGGDSKCPLEATDIIEGGDNNETTRRDELIETLRSIKAFWKEKAPGSCLCEPPTSVCFFMEDASEIWSTSWKNWLWLWPGSVLGRARCRPEWDRERKEKSSANAALLCSPMPVAGTTATTHGLWPRWDFYWVSLEMRNTFYNFLIIIGPRQAG